MQGFGLSSPVRSTRGLRQRGSPRLSCLLTATVAVPQEQRLSESWPRLLGSSSSAQLGTFLGSPRRVTDATSRCRRKQEATDRPVLHPLAPDRPRRGGACRQVASSPTPDQLIHKQLLPTRRRPRGRPLPRGRPRGLLLVWSLQAGRR